MSLKNTDIERLKKKLGLLRAQITHTIKETSDEAKQHEDSMGYSQHQADQGTDDFDKTISLELSSQEYDILKKIDRALQKIEEGSYGKCDVSGEDIPLARLEAIPYANVTVKTQELMEKGLL